MAVGCAAQGTFKKLAYKIETTFGTAAGQSGGSLIRRVEGTLNLAKEGYESNEIRTDYQVSDFRHGVRDVKGTLSGELSPKSYADFFAAALSKNFAVGASATALTDITASATAPHFVRAAGSFLVDGFKVGDVVRWSGFTATANNACNYVISALTATDMTVIPVKKDVVVVAEAAGSTVSVAVVGKKTFVPQTGHTSDSFTFEDWHEDKSLSNVYVGNKVNTIAVTMPPTGISTVNFDFMGQDLAIKGTTQYFTTPTALPTTGLLTGINGILLINGVQAALVTSMNFNINRNITGEAVLGSNIKPCLYNGRAKVDGSMSVQYKDNDLFNYFDEETEISVSVLMTTDNGKDADFISFTFPRVKINSFDKTDTEGAVTATCNFVALLPDSTTAFEQSTIIVQDSLA